MVQISASILDAKENEAAKIFYNLEVAKIYLLYTSRCVYEQGLTHMV